ncbi:hypothetical protein [uncultured Bacteroides sp.]|uniref:hypothetical protein n=1 Tax=uncultured Bacteroides sp. TaxID=162156 RepID=UPI0025958B5F|nr:hypothetical protein [uncultured Bacteroides sp.]
MEGYTEASGELSARDRQVDELIGMLKDQIREYKKSCYPNGRSCNQTRGTDGTEA